ncbi:MAG: glycosyltransferase family 39 protein, partial [Candidatus Thorarchaeota archaeon]
MELSDIKRHTVRFIVEYTIFIAILIVGLYVWANVFQIAVADYLDTDIWVTRHGWLGSGEYEIFGYVIHYQFEGYSDYSFYYVHWGTNMVNGLMPYGDGFGFIEIDGVTNRNGAHMFPPLTSILYGLGMLIPVDNWGIGLLLAAFGFLTVFPVYGLGKELSNNRHVGEIAALTYVLSPNVLYHTTYLWTNPAPFIFFFFAGYYFLVRGNRHVGTLLIVTAALFKQTAWFLGIPLVVYLLMKERAPPPKQEEKPVQQPEEASTSGEEPEEPKKSIVDRLFGFTNEYLDVKGFIVSVIVVLGFAGAIFYPFLVAQSNLWAFLRLAMGSFPLQSFTEVPGYGGPMRLQV